MQFCKRISYNAVDAPGRLMFAMKFVRFAEPFQQAQTANVRTPRGWFIGKSGPHMESGLQMSEAVQTPL
jgi:hypothetical protein